MGKLQEFTREEVLEATRSLPEDSKALLEVHYGTKNSFNILKGKEQKVYELLDTCFGEKRSSRSNNSQPVFSADEVNEAIGALALEEATILANTKGL